MSDAARIRLKPEVMERLQAGDTAVFRIPEGIREIRVSIEPYDSNAHFTAVFDGIWRRILKRLDKTT